MHRVVKCANRAGRVSIQCYGLDNLPEDNGYVIFPNHQGLFDVLIILETHERPFGTIMKKETDTNFFLRNIRKVFNGILIDREDIRQSMKVIQEMTKQVKAGRNFVIFAEGTRSKKGNHLLEFKGGSFKSATKAQAPIVPVAIIDSYKAFDTNSIEPLTVQIHYLPPLYYQDYQNLKTSEIAQIVAERIRTTIEQYDTNYIKEERGE